MGTETRAPDWSGQGAHADRRRRPASCHPCLAWIGKELGVSHERVRQLQEEALDLLRHHAELQ
ncbi:sigma factor-like helix-turn-helix DNA-binding protein [Acidithiobacillus thiooxidans]|uniref:sigma factor-like helix-turn-helix DNA-binding protein n=1 Tax=Acidithiobacillus thiooxidans TaxID=930 RepID=UPI003B50E5E0